jgi:hypothetical protein
MKQIEVNRGKHPKLAAFFDRWTDKQVRKGCWILLALLIIGLILNWKLNDIWPVIQKIINGGGQ